MNCDQKKLDRKNQTFGVSTQVLFFFIPQLSPPSDELALQTNFRYDSRKCF